ncbi:MULTISPECIES: cysteine desulfurase family protein [unclassified Exiguobacterium]|uniref:cysteine desulfurase family protein n=1 Tax=unclassified Exiguobacterium TaxID=2644629 RepID=UPI000B5900E5|nr:MULTISPECIES: cysteine desulfurase family protein [unclassified Exiguobacterium]ASI35937.1 cysteine desulfurase NifS [Exiguobacterium sp. N4-1P]
MMYFDHAATTPMHPDVLQTMTPYMLEQFGNPSSVHAFGRSGRAAIDAARRTIASELNAKPNEIIFTAGGTESDNYAILGAAMKHQDKGQHVITTRFEHHAVLRAFEELEKRGFDVTYLEVPESGIVTVDALAAALRPDTILVSVMFGNNEVGTLQPIKEMGQLLNKQNILFHTDAVQVFGKLSLDVEACHIDLLSASSHKINGPKGVGMLYVRTGVQLEVQSYGGEQERKRRAGTENVAGIVGFAKAVQLIVAERDILKAQSEDLRRLLLNRLEASSISYEQNGHPGLPHIVNLYFPRVEIEPFLIMLDMRGIAVSSGSACTAGSIEPSHVLSAMYGENDRTRQSVRISFGRGNDAGQVELLAQGLIDVVKSFQNK